MVRDKLGAPLKGVPIASLKRLAADVNEDSLLRNALVAYDRASLQEGIIDHYFVMAVSHAQAAKARAAAENVPPAPQNENAAPQGDHAEPRKPRVQGPFKTAFKRAFGERLGGNELVGRVGFRRGS